MERENNESLHEKDKVRGPKKRQSGKRCVVMFCSKTNADGVSLHQFPKDEKVRRKWISFVRIKREPNSWTPGTGHICSDHFTADSYEGFGAKLAGYASKLILKKTAVPSIQAAPTPEQLNTARRLKRKLTPTEEKPNSKGKDHNDELQWYKTPKRSSRALAKLTANRLITEYQQTLQKEEIDAHAIPCTSSNSEPQDGPREDENASNTFQNFTESLHS